MKLKRKRLARFGFKDFTKWWWNNKYGIKIKPFQNKCWMERQLFPMQKKTYI